MTDWDSFISDVVIKKADTHDEYLKEIEGLCAAINSLDFAASRIVRSDGSNYKLFVSPKYRPDEQNLLVSTQILGDSVSFMYPHEQYIKSKDDLAETLKKIYVAPEVSAMMLDMRYRLKTPFYASAYMSALFAAIASSSGTRIALNLDDAKSFYSAKDGETFAVAWRDGFSSLEDGKALVVLHGMHASYLGRNGDKVSLRRIHI